VFARSQSLTRGFGLVDVQVSNVAACVVTTPLSRRSRAEVAALLGVTIVPRHCTDGGPRGPYTPAHQGRVAGALRPVRQPGHSARVGLGISDSRSALFIGSTHPDGVLQCRCRESTVLSFQGGQGLTAGADDAERRIDSPLLQQDRIPPLKVRCATAVIDVRKRTLDEACQTYPFG